MFIEFCKSKLAHATITDSHLHYEGSITVDIDLLNVVDIVPGEKVQILNMNNGQRFDTYAIEGKAGSGEVCLNGPAARLGLIGDKIMILSYAMVDHQEAKTIKTKVAHLNDKNEIKV